MKICGSGTVAVFALDGDDTIMLTVRGASGRACIYVSVEKGKLVLTGGASIIHSIQGEGMAAKIKK